MTATKVSAVGFELSLAKNIEFSEFYQQLESIEETEIRVYGKNHVLLTDIVDNYVVGLVLSYTGDKKSIATSKSEKGELLVQKGELLANQHKTEAALFVLNPDNLKGVMFRYYGSMSATGFHKFLEKQHNILWRRKVKDKVQELSQHGDKDKEKAQKAARKFFSGNLKLKVMVRKNDLKKLIAKYKTISSLEARVGPEFETSQKFEPLRVVSKGTSISVRLDNNGWKPNQIRTAITNTINGIGQSEFEALSLVGRDLHGEVLREYLGENMEHFFKLDYDEYVALLPQIRWRDYQTCRAMKQLTSIIKDAKVTFGKPKKVSTWKLKSAKDLVP